MRIVFFGENIRMESFFFGLSFSDLGDLGIVALFGIISTSFITPY